MHSTEIIVWIVEDDDLYRATVADLINETDAMRCPHTFTTCEAAIATLHKGEAQDLPDVILMDIGLPGGMSGVDGAGVIKALIPTSQIIMVTVRDADEVVFEALRAGASGYLLKNAPLNRVLAAIEETYRGGVPMTASIARKVLHLFRDQSTPGVDYGLTSREMEILELLVDGLKQKQIAGKLFLSRHTVDSHIRNIYAKLHVHSRARAVAKAVREGLI